MKQKGRAVMLGGWYLHEISALLRMGLLADSAEAMNKRERDSPCTKGE